MAKKAARARTPSRIIWDMIDAEMRFQQVTKLELAKRAHVDRNTVGLDAHDPERIPMHRVWIYFAALGMDAAEVLRPIAQEHAERLIQRGLIQRGGIEC